MFQKTQNLELVSSQLQKHLSTRNLQYSMIQSNCLNKRFSSFQKIHPHPNLLKIIHRPRTSPHSQEGLLQDFSDFRHDSLRPLHLFLSYFSHHRWYLVGSANYSHHFFNHVFQHQSRTYLPHVKKSKYFPFWHCFWYIVFCQLSRRPC